MPKQRNRLGTSHTHNAERTRKALYIKNPSTIPTTSCTGNPGTSVNSRLARGVGQISLSKALIAYTIVAESTMTPIVLRN